MLKPLLLGIVWLGLGISSAEAKEPLDGTIKLFTRAPTPKNALTPLIGFQGTLLVENNCLYFSNKNKAPKILAIWPYGTKVRNNRVVIPRKNGKETYISPKAFFAGGGFVNTLKPAAYKKYASCPNKDYLIVNIL